MKVGFVGHPAAGKGSALKLCLVTWVLWGRGWCTAVMQVWASFLLSRTLVLLSEVG